MKFSIKDFCSRCGHIYWRKKSLIGNFIFCPMNRGEPAEAAILQNIHIQQLTAFCRYFIAVGPFSRNKSHILKKKLRKWYASAPLPPLPIQPNNLFSGKLLHPLHYQLHFAISKGNNSLQRVQLQRGDLFLFMIFSICSFNFWSA